MVLLGLSLFSERVELGSDASKGLEVPPVLGSNIIIV